jgi:uncharacterized protein (DUF58 family)
MMASADAQFSFDPSDIAQIELHILRWMREFTAGDHASLSTGNGFNLVGLKDWEPGDAVSTVDWAQSSLTNFSPLITRQFEQDSNATIIALADNSASTRCGANGVRIQAAISRSLAAIGFAAAFFQDPFGFVTFDGRMHAATSARPRIGKAHVLHCLDLYQRQLNVDTEEPADLSATIAGFARRTAMLVAISDFLIPNTDAVLRNFELLHATHDVMLMMVDARFAYELPATSAGWIEVFDIESEETRVLSRREFGQLRARIDAWQEDFMARARARGLDVVLIGLDRWQTESTLLQLVAERRVRKVRL